MLEIDALHAGYLTASVLQGVSLTVADGEVVSILGRNGMGKSTLLRAVCGLRPPHQTAGSIRLRGEDLAGLPSHVIARRGIALVPQGRRVFRSLTVEENLRLPARRAGRTDIAHVLDLFPRLDERRRQLAGTLSGGEQQMLAIGRALAMEPRLLVMDEPSEGLAPAVIDLIRDRFLHLRKTGLSVLLAEQNVDLALDVADRVAILGDAGTIAWEGLPTELRADPPVLRSLVGL